MAKVPGKDIHVAIPKGGEHVMHLAPSDAERKQYNKEFREQKKHEQKMKEERFAKINERRKKNPAGGSGGGRGINIEVGGN
jgi:hypothetical protein